MSTDQHTDANSRRTFLKTAGVATAGLVTHGLSHTPVHAMPPLPVNPKTAEAMPARNLGRTGYRVAIFSLGGQATLEQPNQEQEAIAIADKAIDLGVN